MAPGNVLCCRFSSRVSLKYQIFQQGTIEISMFTLTHLSLWQELCKKQDTHGCLGYVGCMRDCRIGTLSIKTSIFVRKRESLKIRLIVCIFSERFGDRTTSLVLF